MIFIMNEDLDIESYIKWYGDITEQFICSLSQLSDVIINIHVLRLNDQNGNNIFVMGAAQCVSPREKM